MESLREIFLKQTEYIHSTFDVGRSMFDVHQFFFRLDRPFFLAGGWADTRNLIPETFSYKRKFSNG